jgi:hypothetical protein
MVDHYFEYLTFFAEESELASRLSEAGAEGWRLHTCDTVSAVGVTGVSSVKYLIVMDIGPLLKEEKEPEADEEVVSDFAAMQMK